jgi:MFS transporter, DHA3 family, macrolide efflux protein
MASHPSEQRQAFLALSHRRDFMRLWVGQLLSQIGDQCLLIAAITLISNLSRSPLAMLIPVISMIAPQVIFGLMGGVLADRWNRKRLMIVSDVMRGLIVLAVLAVSRARDLWILYAVAAGLAFMGAFFYPARNAALPNLVPPELLMSANGMVQVSYIIALIIGPAIAGPVVELWLPAAIAFDSATFIASAILIGGMRIPAVADRQPRHEGRPTVWIDMLAGVRFIRRNKPLWQTMIITAVATLGVGAIILLAVPHLKQELEANGLEYGLAMSMLGVGSVVGGVVVHRLSRRFTASTLVGGLLVLGGAAIVLFAYAPSFVAVLLSVAVLGLCVVIARGALETIIQALTPDRMRGRVQSAANLLVVASTAAAEGLFAVLGSVFEVQKVFIAAGAITAAAGVASAFTLRTAARLAANRHTLEDLAPSAD